MKLDEKEANLDDLDIHIGSAYELEQDLTRHPRQCARYYKLRAQAVRELDDLYLNLKITTSEIVKEILDNEYVPPSAISEIRKTRVPLDKRYQILQRRVNAAKEKVDVLTGMIVGAEARGYRFRELVSMARPLLMPDINQIEDKQSNLQEWRGE